MPGFEGSVGLHFDGDPLCENGSWWGDKFTRVLSLIEEDVQQQLGQGSIGSSCSGELQQLPCNQARPGILQDH
eukprot:12881629-Prorocentrum_lima.AAC.1